MKDKRVYTPPTLITERLTVGVFGDYSKKVKKPKKPKKIKDVFFWING